MALIFVGSIPENVNHLISEFVDVLANLVDVVLSDGEFLRFFLQLWKLNIVCSSKKILFIQGYTKVPENTRSLLFKH